MNNSLYAPPQSNIGLSVRPPVFASGTGLSGTVFLIELVVSCLVQLYRTAIFGIFLYQLFEMYQSGAFGYSGAMVADRSQLLLNTVLWLLMYLISSLVHGVVITLLLTKSRLFYRWFVVLVAVSLFKAIVASYILLVSGQSLNLLVYLLVPLVILGAESLYVYYSSRLRETLLR